MKHGNLDRAARHVGLRDLETGVHIHVISDSAVQKLKKLKNYYDIIFVKYKYLFGKDKLIDDKYLIKIINKDFKHRCEINQIPYNIKSHSFRSNMITKLLKNTSV